MNKIFKIVSTKTQTIGVILVKGFRKAKPAIVKIQKLSIENVSLLKQLRLKKVIFISVNSYLSEALKAKKILVELISQYINDVTVKFGTIPAPVATGKLTIYIVNPVKLMVFGLNTAKSRLWDKRVMLARVRSNFDITWWGLFNLFCRL